MINITELNKAQKDAVLTTDGPLMILAGAGSGKTKTLVTKISYLLEEKRVSPFQVLALTFSNKAAREMRERVSTEVQSDIGALQITTFHAFCAKLLRSEATYLGLSRNFTIYDTSESKAVVKAILGRYGISQKEISPFEILYYIDQLKNIGFYAGRKIPSDQDTLDELLDDPFYSYYTDYESELHKANAVDFGSLITAVIELFEKFPEVLERYQSRFKFLLVDEYQDTNRAQFELIRMLSDKNNNICVVGDEDQSIYSWRGADIRNILDFEKMYPEAKLLKLEQNYRSSKNIIDAATCVISRNTLRKGKSMWTNNPEGESIDIIECDSDKNEGEFVASEALKLSKMDIPYKEMAVFYRTNSQSRLLEDYLRKSNIPYRVVGGVKFYERKEIKDVLAYLRIVVNSKDSLALSRVINVPARGIGATSLRRLEEEAIRSNLGLWETIGNILKTPEHYTHIKLSAKVKSSLNAFWSMIDEVKNLENKKTPPHLLLEKIIHESGYYDYVKASKDYESIARLENLDELGNAICQYEDSFDDPTLTGFLETITLDTSKEEGENDQRGEVSLMTIHGAKGLEFHYVFVTGVEENVFPSFKSLDNGENGIEEERRLFYVAMTRAMKHLYITFAAGRMLFGNLNYNGPSRFIDEIPQKYYNWKKTSGERTGPRSSGFDDEDFLDDFSQESFYEEVPVVEVNYTTQKSTFKKGSMIAHSLYGEGKVLEIDGHRDDEKVVILFKDGSRKKFMVKFAPLVAL